MRADRRLARDERVAVAPACVRHANERIRHRARPAPRSPRRWPRSAGSRSRNSSSCTARRRKERLVPAGGGVDEGRVDRGARVRELGEVRAASSAWNARIADPSARTGSGQRLAARKRGAIVIAGGRASQLRGVGDRHRHVVGGALPRQEKQSEQDRNPEGDEREPDRIAKFGPTGTAVRVHWLMMLCLVHPSGKENRARASSP